MSTPDSTHLTKIKDYQCPVSGKIELYTCPGGQYYISALLKNQEDRVFFAIEERLKPLLDTGKADVRDLFDKSPSVVVEVLIHGEQKWFHRTDADFDFAGE